MVMEGERGTQTVKHGTCGTCVIFTNQCHPDEFNKKIHLKNVVS